MSSPTPQQQQPQPPTNTMAPGPSHGGAPIPQNKFYPMAPYPNMSAIPQPPTLPRKVTFHLMIRNIPPNVQDEFLFSEIKNTCNIKSFKVPRKPNNENRGKCFLELWSASETELAQSKKKLRAVEILEQRLQVVDYVEKEVLKQIEEEFNFHIDNAPIEVTDEELETWFSKYGDVFSCELKESNETKDGDKVKKHKYGFISFRNEEGAKALRKLKEEEKSGGDQFKIPFRENEFLLISEFRKWEERNKQLKVYANLDEFVEKNGALKSLIEKHNKENSDSSPALDEFKKSVKALLQGYKDEFDANYKELDIPLNLLEIQVIYDKGKLGKEHIYAYFVFERTQTAEDLKTAEESKIDIFADYFLMKKNIFANLDQKNLKTKSSNKHSEEESSMHLKLTNLKETGEGPLKLLENTLSKITPVVDWKYMHISTVKDENEKFGIKVKVIYSLDKKNELKTVVEELKKQDIATSISLKMKSRTTQKLYYAMYTDSFSVNIKDSDITRFRQAIESSNKTAGDIDKITKKISFLRKKPKTDEGGEKKKERVMAIIEMFTKKGRNNVLKNYKQIYDSDLLTGHKSDMFCIDERSAFMIMPYTELDDFIEFKNKFRSKSAPSSQRPSQTGSGTGSEASQALMPSQFVTNIRPQFPGTFNHHYNHPRQMMPNMNMQYRGMNNGQNNRPNYNNHQGGGYRPNHHMTGANSFPKNHQTQHNRNPPQNRPNTIPTQPISQPVSYESVAVIEQHMEEFQKLAGDVQRNCLGRLVHEEVNKQVIEDRFKHLVPRITGMLIDLNVFSIDDIILLLKEPEELKERIQEATELINNDAGNEGQN